MHSILPIVEEPNLAPPGAGLPGPELLVARVLFRWKRWVRSREFFDRAFAAERERIRRVIAGCNAEAGARRVLIERVRGLEDSSRFWSVWMTLDHLRIVHLAIARTIEQLLKGRVPAGKASTAAVKPSLDRTIDIIPDYEVSCEAVVKSVSRAPRLKTRARHPHPWFGPLDVAGWHALAASHLQIHRKQIERIIEGVKGRSASQ